MAFITDNDYEVQTRQEILNLLDGSEPHSALRSAEKMAQDQIRNYIGGKYNLDTVFAEEGDTRDMFIVMIVVDIAIYHLWSKKAPRKVPEHRSLRYQDALDWLKQVAAGAACSLPPIGQEDFNCDIIIESRKLNDNKY
jgi:phage gp36-like protein